MDARARFGAKMSHLQQMLAVMLESWACLKIVNAKIDQNCIFFVSFALFLKFAELGIQLAFSLLLLHFEAKLSVPQLVGST